MFYARGCETKSDVNNFPIIKTTQTFSDTRMGKDIIRSQVATMSCQSKISRKTNIKRIPEDQDKENTGPVVEKDVKASSSLADVSTKEALSKVRKKTARVPPLTLPTSSPLSPAAEEFHLPPYISSLPKLVTPSPA